MATEEPTRDDSTAGLGRGIDGWMHRYSRWRERRLTHLAEMPLSSLAVQTLFLSLCILLDGVVLPWIVVLVAADFSYPLFLLLLVPSLAAEGFVHLRLKAGEK